LLLPSTDPHLVSGRRALPRTWQLQASCGAAKLAASAQTEVGQGGGPVGDDRVLGVGEADGARADRLLELVLDGVLVGGGLGAVLRLGPEVQLALGGAAEFQRHEVVLLVVGGAGVAVPVLDD